MGSSKTKPEKSNSTEANESNNNTTSTTPCIYPQLQIRNCVWNLRNNSNTSTDTYPNEAGSSFGQMQSSVSSNGVNNAMRVNSPNPPTYVWAEESAAKNSSNDGLPSYEEAVTIPIVPESEVEIVNEDESTASDGNGSDDNSDDVTTGDRRHCRRHWHHRRHHGSHDENSEPSATDNEPRRYRHRRRFCRRSN